MIKEELRLRRNRLKDQSLEKSPGEWCAIEMKAGEFDKDVFRFIPYLLNEEYVIITFLCCG